MNTLRFTLLMGGLFAALLMPGCGLQPAKAPVTSKAEAEADASPEVKKSADKDVEAVESGNPAESPEVKPARSKLSNGLEYEDLQRGEGKLARLGSKIRVKTDGQIAKTGESFWSSDDFTCTLKKGALIDGWVLGVPGMREGGRRRLHIPWKLAYGAAGNPGAKIGPKADLIFDIEVLQVF